MKIRFDQGTPAPLRRSFAEGTVVTASERSWGDLSNGELIIAAEKDGFDVFLTTDRNLQYQQNLSERTIAIAVVLQPAWPILKRRADEVAKEVLALVPGDYLEI